MSKNHEPLFFTSTFRQCGREVEEDAFSCVSIDGHPEDENKSGEVVARVWITKRGDIVVDWHNNGCRMNANVLALIEDSKRILREEYQEKRHEKTILQDKFCHNKIRESKLVSFENTFSEFGCGVEEDAFGYITIDGYPEDEDQPGEVVAHVWITKHGDIVVDWHDNCYRENDWVLELIEDSKRTLREEYQEKWHETTLVLSKSQMSKIQQVLNAANESECSYSEESVVFDDAARMVFGFYSVWDKSRECSLSWVTASLFRDNVKPTLSYRRSMACKSASRETLEAVWELTDNDGDGSVYVVKVAVKED